jgi:hypothetical protein
MGGLLLFLGGCSAAAVAVVDNAMSSINGDTCSVSKIFRGEAPCEDPEPKVTVEEEPLHCYRTLGVIDCYRAKDPFAKIEGRSPDDKLQVASPRFTGVTGDNELLNSKRLRADSRPTIVRRSTQLEVEEKIAETKKPVQKEIQPETSAAQRPPMMTKEPLEEEDILDQPMGPVVGKRPPLKS